MDPTPFLDEVLEKFGFLGAQIGIELCESTNASIETSPWSRIRSIEWKDITELEHLFGAADRKTLKEWIERMRVPGTGIFLAE